jgi:hypothetical protein
MTTHKLSKQQKTILVALREFENSISQWNTFYSLVLTVTGVDTWKLELQNRDFRRYSGHEGPRPVFDSNRLKYNNAFSTVSRSIARLVERGLVSWRVTERTRRYPILADDGKRVISEMNPEEIEQISSKVKKVGKSLSKAAKEQVSYLRPPAKTPPRVEKISNGVVTLAPCCPAEGLIINRGTGTDCPK